MRDTILALALVLVLAVGFSLYGPQGTESGGHGGPGHQRLGDTGVIVPGAGAITVTTAEPTEEATQPTSEIAQATVPTSGQSTEEEEITMDNSTDLIWYVAGVVAVLIGEITGPLVAGLWRWVRDRRD